MGVSRLMPDIKFDLQQFADLDDDQLDDEPRPDDSVMFDFDGTQVPFSKLTLDQIGSIRDTYHNVNNFRAETTRNTQKLAREREEFEADRESNKKKLEDYNTVTQFLNSDQEAYQFLMNRLARFQGGMGQQGGFQQGGMQQAPPGMGPQAQALVQQMAQRIEKLEQRLVTSEGKIDESGRDTERVRSMDWLAKTYGGLFDETKYSDYFENKVGDFNNMRDLHNLIFKASLGEQFLATQKKAGTGLEPGTGAPGNLPEQIVIDENKGDPYDQVTEGFMHERGIEET